MRRVWLAVVLGLVIGLGIAVTPRPAGTQDKSMLQLAGVTQSEPPRLEATSQAAAPNSMQYILLGILAGIVVAMPVFLLSRRRFR